jgi:hypothetical protein
MQSRSVQRRKAQGTRRRAATKEQQMRLFKSVDFRRECRMSASATGLAKACVDFSASGALLVWIATVNRSEQVFELEGSTYRADDESEREAVIRAVSMAIDAAIAAA